MAIRRADRVRELYYSYAQATRNWLTANDRPSRPDGLIELGVLLGEGLLNSAPSKAGELASNVREEFLRNWIQSTAKLIDAIEPDSAAEPLSLTPTRTGQRRLNEIFDRIQKQFVSIDGPHDLKPKRQLAFVEEADSP